MNIIAELAKPFPDNAIRWRLGATTSKKDKGIALAYIDARDVMERLDYVVGAENWQDRYPFVGCCEIGLKIGSEWVWKANEAGTTDVEGEKGQYSDAFKRAGVMWGIGRYLYSLPNEWYKIKPRGKSYVLDETPKLPKWATVNGWNVIPPSEKKEVYSQIIECMSRADEAGVRAVWDEYSQEDQAILWSLFNSQERSSIKTVMSGE